MPDSGTDTKAFSPRLILFDLDGTFADTAPDLAAALNELLAQEGRPPLPFPTIRPVASMGGAALVTLGFHIDDRDPGFEDLRNRFLGLYLDNIARHTRLFPGMAEVLSHIEAARARWGIVTNKPAWLTDPLLAALAMQGRAAAIVSGDTVANSKPHPGPLLHACQTTGVPPGESLYIGDARRDVEAAQRAGMPVLVARYGYIPASDDPADWRADGMIDSPLQLLDWLDLHKQDRTAGA